MYKDSEIYKILGIHAIYPTQHTLEKKYVKPYNFLQTHFKLKFLNYNSLFITRDPIERFLSGFNDRVLFQNKLKISYSNNFDKLNFFIDNFDQFLLENIDINWHFNSQYSFLKIYKNLHRKNYQLFCNHSFVCFVFVSFLFYFTIYRWYISI